MGRRVKGSPCHCQDFSDLSLRSISAVVAAAISLCLSREDASRGSRAPARKGTGHFRSLSSSILTAHQVCSHCWWLSQGLAFLRDALGQLVEVLQAGSQGMEKIQFLRSLPRETFARLVSWLGWIVWVLLFLFFRGFWVLGFFLYKLISLMGRSSCSPASCIYEQLRTASDNGKS